jgi:hypothetical protein
MSAASGGREPEPHFVHLYPDEVRAGDILWRINGRAIRGGHMKIREVRHRPAETVLMWTTGSPETRKRVPGEIGASWEFLPERKTRSSRFAYPDDLVTVEREL